MGAMAQLSDSAVEVEPGRGAKVTVTVRNTGTVVDRFSFEAVGEAAEWISFSPETLSLFPDASGSVEASFDPPRQPWVVAGTVPFGVKVTSSEDPEGSVVEEGSVEVGSFSEVALELVPRIVSGRRAGRAQLAVDNRSNCAYRADVRGSDPQDALEVACSPSTVEVPPGGASFVKVRIRPKRTFWRGATRSKQFGVALAAQPLSPEAPSPAPHPEEVSADGTLMQSALLPPWVVKALAVLAALAALLAILWFTLLKPQIRSTAKDQVSKQLAAEGLSVPSGGTSSGGGGGSGSGGGGSGGSTSTTVAPSSGGTSSVSSSGITVNGASQASGNGTQLVYTVPSGRTLQITDLLVENAAGDSGTLTISRSGTMLMQWSLANFRDLDYHWIVPTVFGPGTKLEMVVSGCPNACTPGIYYAGNLVTTG